MEVDSGNKGREHPWDHRLLCPYFLVTISYEIRTSGLSMRELHPPRIIIRPSLGASLQVFVGHFPCPLSKAITELVHLL
jgi:hypothetical protein